MTRKATVPIVLTLPWLTSSAIGALLLLVVSSVRADAPPSPNWLKEITRVAYTDLPNSQRWADWPDRVIADFASAGVQMMFSRVHNGRDSPGLAWRSAYGDPDPAMQGRDGTREVVALCRKHNIRYLAYYWAQMEPDNVGTAHPEWRMLNSAGKPNGYYCGNTGYRDLVRNRIVELVKDVGVDGVFFDMYHAVGDACYCPACKAKFRTQTERDPPIKEDFGSLLWQQWGAPSLPGWLPLGYEEPAIRVMTMMTNGCVPAHSVPGRDVMARYMADIAAREEHLRDARLHPWCGLVMSEKTERWYGRDDPKGRYVKGIYGAYQAMLERHLPVTLVTDRELESVAPLGRRSSPVCESRPNRHCLFQAVAHWSGRRGSDRSRHTQSTARPTRKPIAFPQRTDLSKRPCPCSFRAAPHCLFQAGTRFRVPPSRGAPARLKSYEFISSSASSTSDSSSISACNSSTATRKSL